MGAFWVKKFPTKYYFRRLSLFALTICDSLLFFLLRGCFSATAPFFDFYDLFVIFPAVKQSRNTAISAATIVEPTGVPQRTAIRIPKTAQITEITAELIITERKLSKSLIADRAGKIISAEISSAPTRFIARTITTAVTTAIRML